MSSSERRRSERLSLKIPVDYSAVDAFFTEFSTNINEGGIFIESESPSAIGSLVQLQFRLPGRDEPLTVSGRVTWLSDGKGEAPEGIGVEFLELTPEIREAINDVVRDLKRGPRAQSE
jgi:uncharacterized protein (TIGR02266 family)